MIPLHRLIFAALGAFVFVVQALAQPTPVAVAAGADLIAVSSQHVERQLLRLHFDRAAAKVSLVPFGPPGVEIFAVAPGGAYVVYSATLAGDVGPVSHLFMLDDTGRALGKPVRSPIGAVAGLAVSPRGDRGGDRIAASSERGWMALLAVEGTGPSRRLALRTMFGVSADRPFTSAFRPEGGLVTMTDDWVATYRSPDGAVQHTLDLKTANPDLTPADHDIGSLFQLTWSPRGDRFAVSWGPGPMVTTIFDSAGHRLRPGSAPGDLDLPASKVEFVEGGDAMLLYGMTAPLLVRMKSLAATAFGDPALSVERFVSLAGGRTIAQLAGDRIALWSAAGKRLTQPVGLENYKLGAAAAGATDEVLVAAERGGWVDLYTRDGKFLRRAQSGVRSSRGDVALTADGAVIAALGAADLGVTAQPGGLVWGSALASEGAQDCFVAIAATGSRIVAAGPDAAVRSWSRDGADPLTLALDAAGQAPRRLSGLAVSTRGDAIAIADEGSAVWLVDPDDRRVTRVAQRLRHGV